MKKQVVLITGCSSGVGKELCRKLKSEGYIVVASARKMDSIRDLDTDFFMTLSKNSDERMNNSGSPYFSLYQKDKNYRKRQKRAGLTKSVESMCKIIEKYSMNARYPISLPILFKILIRLPDRIRERLLLKFN
jgi:hypothetical protein